MKVYFKDKDYRVYKIVEIVYNDENYDTYCLTQVRVERNDIEKSYSFVGILSLTDIIRELSKIDLGCDED